jgi:rhamnulokinase
MNPKYYIACDLGAESGRVMLGQLEEGRLTLEEMHRFPSAAVRVLGSLRWDVLRIFEELKIGLRKVAQRRVPITSISVDSWGVDYVLFNAVHPML